MALGATALAMVGVMLVHPSHVDRAAVLGPFGFSGFVHAVALLAHAGLLYGAWALSRYQGLHRPAAGLALSFAALAAIAMINAAVIAMFVIPAAVHGIPDTVAMHDPARQVGNVWVAANRGFAQVYVAFQSIAIVLWALGWRGAMRITGLAAGLGVLGWQLTGSFMPERPHDADRHHRPGRVADRLRRHHVSYRGECRVKRVLQMAALSALAVASGAQAKAGDGCSAPVPLDMSGPRPVLTLTNAAGAEFKAIFDTGAMDSAVDIAQAGKLGVARVGPLQGALSGGTHGDGYQGSFKGMRIGALRLPERPVAVMPTITPYAVAVLSPRLFAGKLVRLDLAAGTLAVCPLALARTLGPATPYTDEQFALPGIAVTMGDQRVLAHIDTGSPMELSFPMSYAKTLPLDGELR